MVSMDARVVVLGLRIAQAIMAIIVLALTAYGMATPHPPLQPISSSTHHAPYTNIQQSPTGGVISGT